MKHSKHLTHESLISRLSQAFMFSSDLRDHFKIGYSIHDTLMAGFACMFFQDPSLLVYQRELDKIERRNNLQSMFHLNLIPSDTQIRDIIETMK